MKSMQNSPFARAFNKKTRPQEFELVMLGGGTGSTGAAWTFAVEGKRFAVPRGKTRRRCGRSAI